MRHERISIDPNVMFGKPVIKGTRVPVEHILRKLAAGQPVQDVLASFPHLVEADVYAALDFAADMIALEEVVMAKPDA